MNDNIKRQTKMKSRMPIGPGRHGAPGGAVEKAKDFRVTMRKLIIYVKPFWISIIVVFIFSIISTIFIIISPSILGKMTNQIVSDLAIVQSFSENSNTVLNNISQINFSKLKFLAFILLGLYIISAIFRYFQGWIMAGVAKKITYSLRSDISKKINKLPLGYFDKQTFGEVISRVTNDIDTVSQTLNQSLSQMVTSFTMIVGILIMMFIISWQMTLVSLILLPFGFLCISVIIRKSQKYFKEQQDSLGQINGHIEEVYAGHNIVKVFGGEKRTIEKFREINNKLYDSAWKSQFLSGLMMPIMMFVNNLGFVSVSVLGAWLALKGMLRIGDIQAFIQYNHQFNQPIIQSANIANILQSTAAAAERVFEFLEEKEEISDRGNCEMKKVKGHVEFKNVFFGYGKEKMIIKDFSVKINPGQRVAIVGPTGAGKTTLVNLLMRFYDVDGGSIKIDDVDIKKIKRADLRNSLGMVLQDTWLFNGTIRENIVYGNADASETEIIEAAKAAHAHHFISALPQGYDMMLNEEADNVSQGEKQLITIARAMLAKSSILILDEATSSVDTRTEILIQQAMNNLMKNKTSFIIAHRLSTIRNADVILVVKDGNIIEKGNHKILMSKNGFYASLYNSQLL